MAVEIMSINEYQKQKVEEPIAESVDAGNSGADNASGTQTIVDDKKVIDDVTKTNSIDDFFSNKDLPDMEARLSYLKKLEDGFNKVGEFETKLTSISQEKETLSTKLQEYEIALNDAKNLNIKDYFADDNEFAKNAIIKGDKTLKSAVNAYFNGADNETLAIEQIMLEKGVKKEVAVRFLNAEYNAFLGDDEDTQETKDLFTEAKAAQLKNKIEQLKANVVIPEPTDHLKVAQEKVALTQKEKEQLVIEKENQRKVWEESKDALISQLDLDESFFKIKIDNEEIAIPKFQILDDYKTAVFNHVLERNELPATKENIKLIADRFASDYIYSNIKQLTEHIAQEAYRNGKAAARKEKANLDTKTVAPTTEVKGSNVKSTPKFNSAQNVAKQMGW